MGHMKRALWWAASCAALLVCALFLWGCSSIPNDRGGDGAKYNLVVVLEKSLDTGLDVIYVRFQKDDDGIPGAVVVIDGDTIETSSASGTGNKTYTQPRWEFGEKIQIKAIDAAASFSYRDSVVIPLDFVIENVLPANRIWRPVEGNALVSWTTSVGAVNYLTSVKARTLGSQTPGFSQYSESQAGLTQVIPPSTFRNPQSNDVVEDVYDIVIIAYTPNFIRRPNPPYKEPSLNDEPAPIQKEDISGGISALVVSRHDTLQAQTE